MVKLKNTNQLLKKQIHKKFEINDVVILQTIENKIVNCYIGSKYLSDDKILKTKAVNINKIKYIFNL